MFEDKDELKYKSPLALISPSTVIVFGAWVLPLPVIEILPVHANNPPLLPALFFTTSEENLI